MGFIKIRSNAYTSKHQFYFLPGSSVQIVLRETTGIELASTMSLSTSSIRSILPSHTAELSPFQYLILSQAIEINQKNGIRRSRNFNKPHYG